MPTGKLFDAIIKHWLLIPRIESPTYQSNIVKTYINYFLENLFLSLARQVTYRLRNVLCMVTWYICWITFIIYGMSVGCVLCDKAGWQLKFESHKGGRATCTKSTYMWPHCAHSPFAFLFLFHFLISFLKGQREVGERRNFCTRASVSLIRST
jgi:hypothetical protein